MKNAIIRRMGEETELQLIKPNLAMAGPSGDDRHKDQGENKDGKGALPIILPKIPWGWLVVIERRIA